VYFVGLPSGFDDTDLQDVTDDADSPHVGGEADGLERDDLRGHEFRSSEQNLETNSIDFVIINFFTIFNK